MLARTPDVVVTYDRLILAVWQTTFVGRHTSTCTSARCGRSSTCPGLVQTVRGVGYRLALAG